MVLAQQGGDVSLFGWYLGLAIFFGVVLVVVIVVSAILALAHRIGTQAEMAIHALDDGRQSTLALWDIQKTNVAAKRILEAARAARGALGG